MFFTKCRYCSSCHSKIHIDAVKLRHGWCGLCKDLVVVTACIVPYWAIIAALMIGLGVCILA